MINRCITYLLLVLLSTMPIFCFEAPANAHAIDYCLEILQETANITINSTGRFNLKKYPEYADVAKDCDKELKSEGLVTLAQVSKDRNVASNVLNGIIAVEDLDPAVRKQKVNNVKQKEEGLKKVRANICGKKAKVDRFACPDWQI